MFTIKNDSHFCRITTETLSICFGMSDCYNAIASDYLRYFNRELDENGNPFSKFNIESYLEKILHNSKIVFKNCAALFHYVSEPESDMLQFKFMKRFYNLRFLNSSFFKVSNAIIEFNFRTPILTFNDFITLKEKGLMDEDFHSSRVYALLHIKHLYSDAACILYVAKFMHDYTSMIDVNDNTYLPIPWEFEPMASLPKSDTALNFVNDAIFEALLLTPYSD